MKIRVSKGLGLDVRFSVSGNELRRMVLELEPKDEIMLAVPGSYGRTCVEIELSENGKLRIMGGSSIIEEITGEGMQEKVTIYPHIG